MSGYTYEVLTWGHTPEGPDGVFKTRYRLKAWTDGEAKMEAFTRSLNNVAYNLVDDINVEIIGKWEE